MPYGWEGNRRSGVALAIRVTDLSAEFTHLRAQWPKKEDEHPTAAYTPVKGMAPLTYCMFYHIKLFNYCIHESNL